MSADANIEHILQQYYLSKLMECYASGDASSLEDDISWSDVSDWMKIHMPGVTVLFPPAGSE